MAEIGNNGDRWYVFKREEGTIYHLHRDFVWRIYSGQDVTKLIFNSYEEAVHYKNQVENLSKITIDLEL